MNLIWQGYAERVGYSIPKPGILRLENNTVLKPVGGTFKQTFEGVHFCQPVYRAMWRLRYRLVKVPRKSSARRGNPKRDAGQEQS